MNMRDDFISTVPVPDARTCCERNQRNCNQGRDCPEATEADDLPRWVGPRLTLAVLTVNAVMLLWLLLVVLNH